MFRNSSSNAGFYNIRFYNMVVTKMEGFFPVCDDIITINSIKLSASSQRSLVFKIYRQVIYVS